MNRLKNYLLTIKPKFYKTTKYQPSPNLILDIGIANKSYLETKRIFPNSRYHGVDYIDHKITMKDGDEFHLINLDDFNGDLQLSEKYDLIIANHVLEHLKNGKEVYQALCRKLNRGGIMYAEFPSIRTAFKEKNKYNYHFHDDNTHKKFYIISELANLAIDNDCQIISCGPSTTPLKNIASIPRAIYSVFTGGGYGADLLHFLGKIDHILVRKI